MDISYYEGKDLLGWIYYNENYSHGDYSNVINRVCYVYPRYILEEDGLVPIPPSDFPNLGSFEVRIQGGYSSEDIVDKLSHLVKVRINNAPEIDKNQQNNLYRLKYNPQYGEDVSDVWLEKFEGDSFYQIIKMDFDFEEFDKTRKIDFFLDDIYSKYIIIQNREGFYGPFDYFIENDSIELLGTSKHGYRIKHVETSAIEENILKVGDKLDKGVELVGAEYFDNIESIKDGIDFISDDVLIESVVSVFDDHNEVGKSDIRALKKSLMDDLYQNEYPEIDDARLARLKNLVRNSDKSEDFLVRIAQYMMEDNKSKDYVIRLILDNRFDEIEERMQLFVEVREALLDLNNKRDEAEKKLNELKNEVDNAHDYLAREHQNMIEEFESQINALEIKKRELEEKIGILDENADLVNLNNELKEKIAAEEARIEKIKENKEALYKELQEGMLDFQSTGKMMGKKLREDGMRDFLSTVQGLKNFDEDEPTPPTVAEFTSREELVYYIYYRMNQVYNHTISKNMIINLLALFASGFITNFTGLSGSGKTSTVINFARALGLSEDNGRFVRVNIDPDIRSIRDLIGFYNPQSSEMVANNVRLMRLLDEDKYPNLPKMVLLDNANLSVPEHYLSTFLEYDPNQLNYINLGAGKEIKITDNLRLYTTLQDDHTSLELSDRYYDKTSTVEVYLEPKVFYQRPKEEYGDRGVVSMDSIMEFGVKGDISSEVDAKLATFLSYFKRFGYRISGRTIEKTRNYIASTSELMYSNTIGSKFLPLELAIMQFIMPGKLIAGTSKRLIENLLSETKNMPLLEERLNKIKTRLENFAVESSVGF